MKFKIAESIEDKGILKAIFMAGSPGSGKSYTLSRISSGSIAPRIVNTDKFVEFFDKGDFKTVINRSKILTEQQLYMYVDSMLPLFVDSTSTHSKNISKRSGILQSLGYDTGMVFVNTSLNVALDRLEQRNKTAPAHRKVNPEWAISAHERIQASKKFYQSRFPFFCEINNNEGELSDDVILDAYKKVKNFFVSPLENPEGARTIKTMRTAGWKYMTEGMITEDYLKRLITVWYV